MPYSNFKIYDAEEANKILGGIRVADCMTLHAVDESDKTLEEGVAAKIKDLMVSNVLNCSYCNVSFNDAAEQRNHFKLDWHRYNLKRALCDKHPVAEDVFDSLAGDVSSISGSESESSDKEDSSSETSEATDAKSCENPATRKQARWRHSKAFFENGDDKIFSVYKCLLQSKKETISNALLVASMCNLITGPKKWLIVMLGGGHFAAAIFNDGVIAEHKTFHCYTVRAKQGGSQSARDGRGGHHPKSAGASLRRYNEQQLVLHVQEIMNAWTESVKACHLILFRATGPYNRAVLFGGKNPPLAKDDPRLRNIPFPTRRATFNEVKRVHDVLSTVELYGSSADFKDKFPRSPDKRVSPHKVKSKEGSEPRGQGPDAVIGDAVKTRKVVDRSKARSSPQREIPGEGAKTSSESDPSDSETALVSSYVDVTLSSELTEYEDTVPQHVKEAFSARRVGDSSKKRRKKSRFDRQFSAIHRKLMAGCESEDKAVLAQALQMAESLPEVDDETDPEKGPIMTKKDFADCLNSGANNENRNTALHVAALRGLPEFVTLLLEAGADPAVKNKNRLTPYVLSANKETRNSFKDYVALHPDEVDWKKANIPGPLTEEMQEVIERKKREKKKMKREKDKIKKKENREKAEEEKERKRFLALSDREKCALAAERRIVAAHTANVKSAKAPVLSRCFQCGVDITGKVPFEYGNNRFCSVPCVKAHRAKTNSFGMEI